MRFLPLLWLAMRAGEIPWYPMALPILAKQGRPTLTDPAAPPGAADDEKDRFFHTLK